MTGKLADASASASRRRTSASDQQEQPGCKRRASASRRKTSASDQQDICKVGIPETQMPQPHAGKPARASSNKSATGRLGTSITNLSLGATTVQPPPRLLDPHIGWLDREERAGKMREGLPQPSRNVVQQDCHSPCDASASLRTNRKRATATTCSCNNLVPSGGALNLKVGPSGYHPGRTTPFYSRVGGRFIPAKGRIHISIFDYPRLCIASLKIIRYL